MDENQYSNFISKVVDFCKGDSPLPDVVELLKTILEVTFLISSKKKYNIMIFRLTRDKI